jgi:hypothetical protein
MRGQLCTERHRSIAPSLDFGRKLNPFFSLHRTATIWHTDIAREWHV